MRGEPFSSGGAGGAGVAGVSTFNTRTGGVTPTVADITGTGLVPGDIGAVSESGGGAEKIVAETSVTTTYVPDVSLGNVFVLPLTGNTEIGVPTDNGSALADGKAYSILLYVVQKVGSGGSKTLTYASGITPLASVLPTLQTAEGAADILALICLGDHTSWLLTHHTAQLAIGSNSLTFTAVDEPANPPSGEVTLWYDLTLQRFIGKKSDGTKFDISSATAPPSSGVITQVTGQLVTGTGSAAGSASLVLPNTPGSGHDVVAMFETDYTGTVTAPSGWAVDAGPYAGTHGIGQVIVARLKSTGVVGDKTAAFTFAGTRGYSMTLQEFAGMAVSPVDKTATAESTGANHVDVTTASTTVASELALCASLTGSPYSGGGAAGWGSSGFATVFDSGGGVFGSKSLVATGAVTASPTFPSNQTSIGVVVTYKAA